MQKKQFMNCAHDPYFYARESLHTVRMISHHVEDMLIARNALELSTNLDGDFLCKV